MIRIPNPMSLVLALFAAVIATGCASLLPVGHAEGVRVHVHNESWSPVEVRAVVGGETLELGRVHPDHYPFFDIDIPDGQDRAELVVVASSARDGEFRTDTIVAGQGAVLTIHLERRAHRSRWWVR